MTLLKGAHSFTMGGVVSRYHAWLKNRTLVPRLVDRHALERSGRGGMFSAANFPGASAANITTAQNLYAFLTGRVTQISGDARIDKSGKYNYLGTGAAARPPHRDRPGLRRISGAGSRT